jgi:hypothetical protein
MQHRENVLLKPVETSAREIGRRGRLAVALAAATVYAVNVDWERIAASAGLNHSRRGRWHFQRIRAF